MALHESRLMDGGRWKEGEELEMMQVIEMRNLVRNILHIQSLAKSVSAFPYTHKFY